jgi:hypothetical protein
MFYTFNQNNSGGGCANDHTRGIGPVVIIEADDGNHAEYRAELIGLYFNGVASGDDCECCGDRWYAPWEGKKYPAYYDENVTTRREVPAPEASVFVHYADGRVIGYDK